MDRNLNRLVTRLRTLDENERHLLFVSIASYGFAYWLTTTQAGEPPLIIEGVAVLSVFAIPFLTALEARHLSSSERYKLAGIYSRLFVVFILISALYAAIFPDVVNNPYADPVYRIFGSGIIFSFFATVGVAILYGIHSITEYRRGQTGDEDIIEEVLDEE